VKHGAPVVAIGPEVDLTYPVTWLGNDLSILSNLPEAVASALRGAARPAVIVGGAALKVPAGRRRRWRSLRPTIWCGPTGTASTCSTRRRRGPAG
jgi:hypothetical protein